MILVIYGHALEVMFNQRADFEVSIAAFDQYRVIFSFHMMAFFAISGMANVNISNKKFHIVIASSLAMIFFAVLSHLLGFALKILLHIFNSEEYYLSLSDLIIPLVKGSWLSLVVIWFLISLAGVQVLAFVYIKYPKSRWGVLALCALPLLLLDRYHGYWMSRTWLPGLVFFLIGHSYRKYGCRVSASAFPILLAIVYLTAPLNHGCSLNFLEHCSDITRPEKFAVLVLTGTYGFIPLFFMTALCGWLMLMSGSEIARIIKIDRPLTYVGSHTLELLLINGVILVFVQPALQSILMPSEDFWRTVAQAATISIPQVLLLFLFKKPVRGLLWASDACSRLVVKWFTRSRGG